jgi:uncharacterized membrane protein (UPF0127 family)
VFVGLYSLWVEASVLEETMPLPTATIMNLTRGTTIAERAELARTFAARGQGLMGRASFTLGEGLVIDPEWSIHMFFMRFPIDVLFVSRENLVVGLRRALPPWAPFAGVAPWRGRYVVELPVGAIDASHTELGDLIQVQ